jgi:hypothetical protein
MTSGCRPLRGLALLIAPLPGVAAQRVPLQALCLRPHSRAEMFTEALPEHPVLTLFGYLIKHFYVIKASSFRIQLLIFLQKIPEDTQAELFAPQIYWQIVESVGEIRCLLGFALWSKPSYFYKGIEEHPAQFLPLPFCKQSCIRRRPTAFGFDVVHFVVGLCRQRLTWLYVPIWATVDLTICGASLGQSLYGYVKFPALLNLNNG